MENDQPYEFHDPVRPAGFWRRTGALLIDMLIIGVVSICLVLLLKEPLASLGDNLWGIGLLLLWLYFAPQESIWGRTVGKRATGIKVLNADGRYPSLVESSMRLLFLAAVLLSREIGETLYRIMGHYLAIGVIVSIITILLACGMTFLVAFNRAKRGIHDYASGTSVVVTRERPPLEAPYSTFAEDARRAAGAFMMALAIAVILIAGLLAATAGLMDTGEFTDLKTLLEERHDLSSVAIAQSREGGTIGVRGTVDRETWHDEESLEERFSAVLNTLRNHDLAYERITISLASGFTIGTGRYEDSEARSYPMQESLAQVTEEFAGGIEACNNLTETRRAACVTSVALAEGEEHCDELTGGRRNYCLAAIAAEQDDLAFCNGETDCVWRFVALTNQTWACMDTPTPEACLETALCHDSATCTERFRERQEVLAALEEAQEEEDYAEMLRLADSVKGERFQFDSWKAFALQQLGRDPTQAFEAMRPVYERLGDERKKLYQDVNLELGKRYKEQGAYQKARANLEKAMPRAQYQRHKTPDWFSTLLAYEEINELEGKEILGRYRQIMERAHLWPEEEAILQMKIDRLSGSHYDAEAAKERIEGLSVTLVPMDGFDAATLDEMCGYLEHLFLLSCTVHEGVTVNIEEPADAAALIPELEGIDEHVIGVTEKHIYIGDLAFVFGASRGPVGVVSTKQLGHYDDYVEEAALLPERRLGIMLATRLGIMMGFGRPSDQRCPLSYTRDLSDIMRKESVLCPESVQNLNRKYPERRPTTEVEQAAMAQTLEKYYYADGGS